MYENGKKVGIENLIIVALLKHKVFFFFYLPSFLLTVREEILAIYEAAVPTNK